MKQPPSYNDLYAAREAEDFTELPYDPNNVAKQQCSCCPFRPHGEGIGSNEMTADEYYRIQATLIGQCSFTSNQYCHREEINNHTQATLCRGARDLQLKLFHSLGVIDSPTDEAWAKAVENYCDTSPRSRNTNL